MPVKARMNCRPRAKKTSLPIRYKKVDLGKIKRLVAKHRSLMQSIHEKIEASTRLTAEDYMTRVY